MELHPSGGVFVVSIEVEECVVNFVMVVVKDCGGGGGGERFWW